MPVRSVWATNPEWDAWIAAAEAAGLTPNGWCRRALNEQAQFERAVAEDESAAKSVPVAEQIWSFDLGAKWKPDPRRK